MLDTISYLMGKKKGGGGGDITVEPLGVTDNGIYTAPTGKAYSPVSVSVPLPQNAHLVTAIESQPVTDASDYPLPKCDITVTDADKCEAIVTDDGVIVEDSEPYNYRQSAGGDTELDKLVGGTIAWNQLCSLTLTSGTKDGVGYANNGDGSISLNNTAEATGHLNLTASLAISTNHKYYVTGYVKVGSNAGCLSFGGIPLDRGNGVIWNNTGYSSTNLWLEYTEGDSFSNTKMYPQITDLTLMFGSTIADYIYSLEQATAGAGVAWLKEHFPKLFDDGYKAYNTGELVSVRATAHETVGFNQWDEEWEVGSIDTDGNNSTSTTNIRSKNYISIVGGAEYYFRNASFNSGTTLPARFYDANKNYIGFKNADGVNIRWNTVAQIPLNARYFRFVCGATYGTTYNNDICINISDASKNGTYEPYIKHSYPLSPVELRGLYKLDANNKLYCDGDSYRCDGRVKRRYGIVDLGTLAYSYAATWGSNTNLFYTNQLQNDVKHGDTDDYIANAIIAGYETTSRDESNGSTADKLLSINSTGQIQIINHSYSNINAFTTAMSGVYLVYELAEPTEEQTSPFEKNQIVDAGGTEEYVDERSVSVPVGHSTKYYNGKAYTKYFAQKSGVVSMADEGIMPMNPMYIEANGEIDAEYWK